MRIYAQRHNSKFNIIMCSDVMQAKNMHSDTLKAEYMRSNTQKAKGKIYGQ